MQTILKKCLLSLLIVSLSISCKNKKTVKQDILFSVESFHVNSDTILRVKLINTTNTNYFITLCRNRTYGFGLFNPEFNNSIIARPFVYENNKLIFPKLEGGVYKTKNISKGEEEWLKKESVKADSFLKDYRSLKNAIFLKKKTIKYVELPFKLKYPHTYNLMNRYVLEKDKLYEFHLEYQMCKTITEKEVKKRSLDSVQKIGFAPYYEKIISNKVPLIID